MHSHLLRHRLGSVLVALFLAAGLGRDACARPARRHARPAHRHGPRGHAPQRPALLRPAQQAARRPGRVAAGRQRRLDPRRRRPARRGALHRAHVVQRHAPFPEERARLVLAVGRRQARRRLEREHGVRRDDLHPAAARRQSRGAGNGPGDPARMGRQRLAHRCGHRGRARRRARGAAQRPGRRGTRAPAEPAAHLQQQPLRRAAADWDRVQPPYDDARRAAAVLSRLVPPGSPGRDRRRRHQRRRDRAQHQGAVCRLAGASQAQAQAGADRDRAAHDARRPGRSPIPSCRQAASTSRSTCVLSRR